MNSLVFFQFLLAFEFGTETLRNGDSCYQTKKIQSLYFIIILSITGLFFYVDNSVPTDYTVPISVAKCEDHFY